MPRNWEGTAPGFTIPWGGLDWTLRLDGPQPGLYHGSTGPILGLAGLAARGRREPVACSGSALSSCERLFDRVVATYCPPNWGGMTVRAAWRPVGESAMDLELQVNVLSVGELDDVEVFSATRVDPAGPYPAHPPTVVPRDAHCATFSYDGREPDLATLTTLPARGREPAPPLVFRLSDAPGLCYVEFGHPDDESRLITRGPSVAERGFFGYDLEKGVVLRGRLRGLWLPEAELAAALPREQHAFLAEPLPLTT